MHIRSLFHRKSAFTLVEVMVAILVFTLGLLSTYVLIQSVTSVSNRSRDEIIGGNILREQLELVKNIRDGNWLRMERFDKISTKGVEFNGDAAAALCDPASDQHCLKPGYYTIENSYTSAGLPVKMTWIGDVAPTKASIIAELSAPSTKLRLCRDAQDRYAHDCSSGTRKSPFFSYIRIEPYMSSDFGDPMNLTGALSVSSYFVSVDAGYRTLDMHTIITDWKR